MDLSRFQESVVPAVNEVLRSGIGLDAATEAFMVKAVHMALEESGGNGAMAARKLGVKQNFISQVKDGKRLTRFRGKPEAQQK